METKEDTKRDANRLLIFMGMSGHFAYSRCLRFRFPFNNIVGVRLQSSIFSNESACLDGGDENSGAVLIF